MTCKSVRKAAKHMMYFGLEGVNKRKLHVLENTHIVKNKIPPESLGQEESFGSSFINL